MKLEYTSNVADVLGRLKYNFEQTASQLVAELGQAQILNINERMDAGHGLDDQSMPAYKAATVAARRRKGKQTSIRTLTDTGQMRRSMHVQRVTKGPDGWAAYINFTTREDALKAAYQQQMTPWFGISPADRARLDEIVRLRLGQFAGSATR